MFGSLLDSGFMRVPCCCHEVFFQDYSDYVKEMIRHCRRNAKIIEAGFKCKSLFVGADQRNELLEPVVN